MFLTIVLGFIGLGILVFVHELGHFLAARAVGIDVEAFSIGWGHPIFSKRIGKVEYRIGALPIGGYCKMRGETEFQEALSNKRSEIPRDSGTFYGSAPWRRILVAFAGPAANILLAVVLLSVMWGVGVEIAASGNRIIVVPEMSKGVVSPASKAGFQTGDFIVEVDGKRIVNSQDVLEAIAPNPEKKLQVVVDRDGQKLPLQVTPMLDKSSGAGRIGVTFWTDPIVASVKKGSDAALAGIKAGDRITAVNGQSVKNLDEIYAIVKDKPNRLTLEVLRGAETTSLDMVLTWQDNGRLDTGISYASPKMRTPALGFPEAIAKGAAESYRIFTVSLSSLGLLFRGIDLTKAVSGPVRITYMLGEVAVDGFEQGLGQGMSAIAGFLAFLSIALFIMNLLPIPALDGGLIILFLIETVIRKPLNPRFLYYFQLVGTTFVFGLLLFALFGDILFLIGR